MTASYAIFRGGLKINAYEKILLMAICLFLLLPFGIQFKKTLDENKKIEIHNQRVKMRRNVWMPDNGNAPKIPPAKIQTADPRKSRAGH